MIHHYHLLKIFQMEEITYPTLLSIAVLYGHCKMKWGTNFFHCRTGGFITVVENRCKLRCGLLGRLSWRAVHEACIQYNYQQPEQKHKTINYNLSRTSTLQFCWIIFLCERGYVGVIFSQFLCLFVLTLEQLSLRLVSQPSALCRVFESYPFFFFLSKRQYFFFLMKIIYAYKWFPKKK